MARILCIHPDDDLLVALQDLAEGEEVAWEGDRIELRTAVPAKHKLARRDLALGETVRLYGVPVGRTTQPIGRGEGVTTANLEHFAAPVDLTGARARAWVPPDTAGWEGATFQGIVRPDGRVGTANHWLILPLVFCENRNVERLREALEGPLGYGTTDLVDYARSLLAGGDAGHTEPGRPYPNLDGIRAITHAGGCGGTRADARSLCRLLAAYADHPNVAGLTVFSLGCQNAETTLFREVLAQRNPAFHKPLLVFEQQAWDDDEAMMRAAVRDTLAQLPGAAAVERRPVPVSHLKLGLKCGGSDGFSGLTANPAMGVVADLVVALGGSAILAEFPELCGVEADLLERCAEPGDRRRFLELMRAFQAQALAAGTRFADNPSPGNIRDGLITDAMKSAGAARKGGTSPIEAVLDYGESASRPGLSLLCTPGNDVESVTGIVGSGANVVLFSTGLGTPTGNPIVPVLKLATNSTVARRHDALIDFDCGPVLQGAAPADLGARLLDQVLAAAGGRYRAKADRLGQFDFGFWKRDISL